MYLVGSGFAHFYDLSVVAYRHPGEGGVEIHADFFVTDLKDRAYHAIALGSHHRKHRSRFDLFGKLAFAQEDVFVEFYNVILAARTESRLGRKDGLETVSRL